MKRLATIATTLVALTVGFTAANFWSSSSAQRSQPPLHMLWAWERPEILSFVQTRDTGVAYLATTVHISKRKLTALAEPTVRVFVENRAQPLEVTPNTYLMAVIRIESDGSLIASDSIAVRRVVDIIHAMMRPKVSAIQVDFDARKSEREWYQSLLTTIRKELPEHYYLSMTSLASWCLGDDWILRMNLPVDEVVPMFFDMGADARSIQIALDNGNTFGHRLNSIGVRAGEADINTLIGKTASKMFNGKPRVYMFSHKAWNPEKAQKLIGEVDGWK